MTHLPAGPGAEIDTIIAHWQHQTRATSTAARIDELARRFATRLTATGVASLHDADLADCENFVWAPTRRGQPPAMHTVHLRRTVVRAIYRTLVELDPTRTDPTRQLDLPAKPAGGTRPLTDNEITLVRTTALTHPHQPARVAVTVALAEATATTGELHQICWEHLDLTTGTVELPGADPVTARTGTLTRWGHGVLTTHHADGFVIERRTPFRDPHSGQAAMSNLLARLLNDAGIHDPAVKPSSIRLWGARQHLTTSGIEAAARALGYDSLDRAATTLHHHW